MMELPSSYASYCEFREEMQNILIACDKWGIDHLVKSIVNICSYRLSYKIVSIGSSIELFLDFEYTVILHIGTLLVIFVADESICLLVK